MKFLTFMDLHENAKMRKELLKRASEPDVDFILCAGDFSTFGRGLTKNLTEFSSCGKKIYLVPGNHEENLPLDSIIKEFPLCENLHARALRIGHYLFLGYGGNGFSQQDEGFRKIAREWYSRYQEEKIVLVTHGPPFGTKLDLLPQGHVGHRDYRKFIERIKPKLVICGHLHETAGVVDVIGKTKLINPGWEGKVVELN